MKLSLCITTYNRYELTIESFAKVLDDPRIDDIVIVDDCSTDGSGLRLANEFKDHTKVKVFLQVKNRGMSKNKRDAIAWAKNEWAIIFDSDNIIDHAYLDAFFEYIQLYGKRINLKYQPSSISGATMPPLPNNFIFCPDFARPTFDYRAFSRAQAPTFGIYDAKDAARCITDSRFNCLMNTCNYVVNCDFYLQVYKYDHKHIASDTVWHNYNHLKAGGMFSVVPNMQYSHRVHDGSGFKQDIEYNMSKTEEVRQLIKQL